MNSGPVLYFIYLIFAKTKKIFIVVQIYLHLVVLGRALGIVYPDVLATKSDEVVRKHI